MVGDIFQPTHLLFVLVVALLVLGPKRLPEVGRTLGSGIRDFRQALSGETPDRSQRQDSDQVPPTTTEMGHQPETRADDDITWPDEAVGPTFYDEPVAAATAEPTIETVSDDDSAETATAVVDAPTFSEPATEVVSDHEAATEVVTDHEPATASSTNEADARHTPDLDALYFSASAGQADSAADGSDSSQPESHIDQSS